MKKIFSIILSVFLLPAMLFMSGCGKKPPKGPEASDEFVYEVSEDGKYVYFGEYPQTIKTDDVAIISQTPDSDGYYLGSDGERYYKHVVDFNMNFIQSEADWKAFGLATLSNNYVYSQGETLYFKVEKLKWRILKQENDAAFIVCDSVIYSTPYQQNYEEDTMGDCGWYVTDGNGNWIYEEDGETKIYGNNYKYSQLRNFLINDFYNTAFSNKEKEIINLTEVDNSAVTTGNASNPYFCANTNDYVFALSYEDLTNAEYGFDTDAKAGDFARRWYNTDYAKATGAFSYTSLYVVNKFGVEIGSESYDSYSPYFDTAIPWLRSPFYYYEFDALEVNCGYSYTSRTVHLTGNGVVPAMRIRFAD